MKKLFNVVLLVLCVTSCELLRPWTPVNDKTQYTKMTVLSLEDNNEYEFLLNRITGPGSGEPYIYKYSSITGEDKYNIGIGGESLYDDNPYSAAAGTLELCVALNHPLTIGEKYYIPSGQSDDYRLDFFTGGLDIELQDICLYDKKGRRENHKWLNVTEGLLEIIPPSVENDNYSAVRFNFLAVDQDGNEYECKGETRSKP